MNRVLIADAHCDTITKIMEKNEKLFKNTCHSDITRIKGFTGFVQVFAAYIEDIYGQAYAMRRAIEIIDKFYSETEQNKDHVHFCTSGHDIDQAIEEGKIAAILSIENGIALQGELSALRIFYRLGVRSICLTRNLRNEIGEGVKSGSTGGLTAFGRSVVEEMNRLGMVVDVSHLSEAGFWDVAQTSKAPFIASHSNSRKLCSHPRNLDDRQLAEVARVGGFIGVNIYPYFLTGTEKAGLPDIIRHIEHMVAVAGIDHIGLGADFDGIECTPEGIKGVEDINIIFEELARLNYSQQEIEKIAGLNLIRIYKAVLKE